MNNTFLADVLNGVLTNRMDPFTIFLLIAMFGYLLRLERRLDKKFAQIDYQFSLIEKRFQQIEKEFLLLRQEMKDKFLALTYAIKEVDYKVTLKHEALEARIQKLESQVENQNLKSKQA